MNTGLRLPFRVMASAMLVVVCGLGHADEPPPAGASFAVSPGAFDPAATALLQRVSTYIAGINDLSFSASLRKRHVTCGVEVENEEYQFKFKRPNLFSMSMKLPDDTLTVTADGHKMMLAFDAAKEYRIQDQPEDLGTLVGWLTQQPAFRRIFSRCLTAGWTENVRQAHCEKETIDGTPCDRLEMTFDRTDVAIWFQSAGPGSSPLPPVPVALFADLSRTTNHPKGSVTTDIVWNEWSTAQNLDPNAFAIHPPAGFKEVKSFNVEQSAKNSGNLQDAWLGRQAPPFTLDLAAGGTTSLADHVGKHIVILEWWATWCRPCRHSLEDMETQLPYFAKHDVAVYAVNLQESADKVDEFVKKANLKLPAALDTKGELAEQLHLEAVPTCIIIGRDGSVQAVHVGYDKGALKTIRNEIEALSEGKEPASDHVSSTASGRLRNRLELDEQAYCAVFVGY